MNRLVDIFADHLRREAVRFFPSITPSAIAITFRSEAQRPSATLYRFDVSGSSESHPVLIKVRHERLNSDEVEQERPRRYTPDADEKFWREAEALKLIESHFSNQDSSCFGFIRVLDIMPEQWAVIMTESQDPSLRPLFLRQNRLQSRGNPRDLTPILRNVGAWLRHYHSLPPDASVDICYTTRDDYVRSVQTFIDFLVAQRGEGRFFHPLRALLEDRAGQYLPETLPCGRLHGDFSTRNILVAENHRVTVIDTLAKWHVPIYEDMGTFLSWFHINYLQVLTQGWGLDSRWMRRCELAFLQGYYGEVPIPYPAIALFEIHALLDKWTSLVEHFERRRSTSRALADSIRDTLSHRQIKVVIQGLLDHMGEEMK